MANDCNETLRDAMLDVSDAFCPDIDDLESELESGALSMLETKAAAMNILRDLTEYSAIHAAVNLRRAARLPLRMQLEAVDAAHKRGIGAPGDWGYGSDRGKAWYACLKAADKAEKEAQP